MSNSSNNAPLQSENVAVAGIIAGVGIFGLISNGAAIAAVIFNPVLKNSFGLLCLSHSIANFGVLLAFTFWVAPMTVV
ncbi:unnamed protein product [Nippostrongylus brasiliensis]|uniref:7TM_GPCR_Srx domain-containing protein n=1 Tax=Nippostrongylus brasiliensis TaxID=27835 RepID=A0A0N4XPM1_NIPBR|nr:unnamed protein product [Nippostrongylus brasiliensis]